MYNFFILYVYMYCVHVFAIVYVFVCTIVVCGCICLYVYVPPMRKSGYADHCEVKSSINQSINQMVKSTPHNSSPRPF